MVFTAAFFRQSIEEVTKMEGVSLDVGNLYEIAQLVKLTGWSIEYIENLGLLYREGLLQIYDAENHLKYARR